MTCEKVLIEGPIVREDRGFIYVQISCAHMQFEAKFAPQAKKVKAA